MATTSSTTKAKPDNQNLTRTKSLGRKPKLPSSASSEDGSDKKPEKPLPNYLKPTISSKPDPVKFVKKNNNSLDDNQKLLRRRSFDRPPSSFTSPSTSSPRIQKSLNVSPSGPQDRPAVPREKPVTALRSSSFQGSRGVPRGGATVKQPPVAPKKSGLSSSSISLKSKKEGSANVKTKKASEKEIALDTASLSSAQEDEEEILKIESDVQVAELADDIEEPKDKKENKEVHVEVVEAYESGGDNESSGPTTVVFPVGEDCIAVNKEDEKEEEEKEEDILINEDKIEEKIEETKEHDSKHDNKVEDEEEVKKKIDEEETPEKVDIDMKEVESVEETTEEKGEEVKEKQEVKEEKKEKEKVKEEEKEKVKEEEKEKVEQGEKEKVKEEASEEGKKREVVKGKKVSPSAYNDVIASKMQENPRKNKVLALAGAFQTVIDYETAASK
uniref:Calmodulin-binding domain-containing protein n=1 Tax=Noccaea caerulescens TaxID=107243 RepID=A0A1J3EYT6_NOCCA